ncbi:MAG: hypothetical protein ACXWTS_07620 [Methylococcaceae bacterium]
MSKQAFLTRVEGLPVFFWCKKIKSWCNFHPFAAALPVENRTCVTAFNQEFFSVTQCGFIRTVSLP